MTNTKKNLALIHLESISNIILWQYRVELSTIWDLMEKSRVFNRFYVSATSTSMSHHSLIAGYDALNDHLPRYQGSAIYDPQGVGSIIWDLIAKGYDWKHFALENIGPHIEIDNETVFPRLKRSSYLQKLLPLFAEWLAEKRTEGQSFAFLFQNDVTHMASDEDLKNQSGSFSERFRVAYRQLDASVAAVLNFLQEYGFLENTLIVCYGDHGDELWSHTLSRGFCHGITPYGSLVWTPLFIYDNGSGIGNSNELISAVDLREILLRKLIPETLHDDSLLGYKSVSPSSTGIDISAQKREFAFSQNLYALQLEYTDFENALTKGYSVTDGTYRLVASSGGRRLKEGGLELFYDRLDPSNSRNLLDFFSLGADGRITNFRAPPFTADRAFLQLLTPQAVEHLTNAYYRLRDALHKYVRNKEADAMKHNQGEYHTMPESVFAHVKKRVRRDYEE